MEQLDKLLLGWVAIESLGLTAIIWRGITFYFSHKALEKQVAILETHNTVFSKKLEKLEDKIQSKLDELSKNNQDARESQILQQASLDQIKQSLQMLSNQLLDKKID